MEEWSDQLLPEGFRKRMLRLLGKEAEDAFLASYSAAPLRRGLRVNTLKCGIHRLRELFSLPLEPLPFSTAGFFLPTEHRAGADPLHHAGAYYMQEPSAMVRRDRAGPPAGRTGTGSLRRHPAENPPRSPPRWMAAACSGPTNTSAAAPLFCSRTWNAAAYAMPWSPPPPSNLCAAG